MIISGVPQGSVLGPTLFLLYMADLAAELETPLCCYADDSTLIRIIKTAEERADAAASLQRDLVRISNWADRWKMVFNPGKTQLLTVSGRRVRDNDHQIISFDGKQLEEKQTIKVLGVLFDSKLTFSNHIRHLAIRATNG